LRGESESGGLKRKRESGGMKVLKFGKKKTLGKPKKELGKNYL